MNSRTNNGRGGIILDSGVYGINISSNKIYTYGVNSTAIFSWGNESTIESNNLTTFGVYSMGIYLEESEEMNLTGNNITTAGNNSGGIFAGTRSNDTRVYNNRINTSGSSSDGIYVDSSSNLNLTLNNLTGTGSYGIYLNYCIDLLVYSNTITNAETYGIYDSVSSSTNISSNTISGTRGTGNYVFGISSENATSGVVGSNTLFGNDEGSGNYCGGIAVWYANTTISSNIIYGNLNDSCNITTGIKIILDSGKNSLTINNNEINSSAGNNSYGVIFETADGSSIDTIAGVGNTIRNSDYCLHFEVGKFITSGFNLESCGTYDVCSVSNVLATAFNTTAKIINSTVDVSKLNASEYSNLSLQEYVRGYVNSSGSAISGATVTLANNNSAEQQWSATTGSDGYTSYSGATYYFYNSTGGYNYSSMTATASKTGYDSNSVSSVITGQSTINISLTVSEVEDSSGSSGSSSSTPSFWTNTYVLNENETSAFEGDGLTKVLSPKNRVRVVLNGTTHHMGLSI